MSDTATGRHSLQIVTFILKIVSSTRGNVGRKVRIFGVMGN